jgi:multiple sugar transport system permease protein
VLAVRDDAQAETGPEKTLDTGATFGYSTTFFLRITETFPLRKTCMGSSSGSDRTPSTGLPGRRRQSRYSPFLYLLPAAAVIFVFRLLPIVSSFYISFFRWGLIRGPFLGLGNYRYMFQDPKFWQSLLNTVYFVIGMVPASLFLSLFIAVLLSKKIKAMGVFRTTYFLPVVTSLVAVSMVWKWIYHPEMGLANYFLQLIGIDKLLWLSESTGVIKLALGGLGITVPDWAGGPSLALYGIIVMSVWKGLGYNIIIFLAGLQNIPEQYYEAARIDGAGARATFWHITWPILSPITFYVLMVTTIVTFQVFTQIWMMTTPQGGPLGTTKVLVFYLYEQGFMEGFDRGYASAIALVLFLILLSLSILQRRLVERKVHYA